MLSTTDYINRCLDLAELGKGKTLSNPMVGCVIVHNNIIIGEGFHQEYGGAHAEVNAIRSVKDKSLLPESTLCVSLEPCSHQGKTPPCADLIIQNGIKKVIIGNLDPNPLVNGKGVKKLAAAGIEVTYGYCSEREAKINKRFRTFMHHKRPYVILKWAQTIDGFIDYQRSPGEKPAWITNHALKVLVHKWRSEEAAIMVGTNTARLDNPRLNVRLWDGKNPLRLAIDRKLTLSTNLHLFNQDQDTIIYNGMQKNRVQNKTEFKSIEFDQDVLKQVLDDLFNRKISSVIVEGGSILHNSFFQMGYWDEARILIGNKRFQKGVAAPDIPKEAIANDTHSIGGDRLQIYYNHANHA